MPGALVEGRPNEAGRMRFASREVVEHGEPVDIEVSFGPMADEVVLHGSVCAVHPRDGLAPLVEIAFPEREKHRVDYIRQILNGHREASARRHRRVPVDIDVRWRWGDARYASRVRDLSRGGAFIASRCLPQVGARVHVELRPGASNTPPLLLGAVVSWVRQEGRVTGFGVHFKLQDRDTAARLQSVVRDLEQTR